MSWRAKQFALAFAGIALGGGILGRGTLSTRDDTFPVILGTIVVVLGFTSLILALFSSGPISTTDSTITVSPDALVALFRRYARRSRGRRVLVVASGLFLLVEVTRFVVSLAQRRWALVGANTLWLVGMAALVVIVGSELQRNTPPVDKSDPRGEQSRPEEARAPSPTVAARRLPTKEGWYQEDGRWYCKAHGTRYCKVCAAKQAPTA